MCISRVDRGLCEQQPNIRGVQDQQDSENSLPSPRLFSLLFKIEISENSSDPVIEKSVYLINEVLQ